MCLTTKKFYVFFFVVDKYVIYIAITREDLCLFNNIWGYKNEVVVS